MELEPGLRRLRADNASPMTFTGTNTYILGTSHLAIIDPGPEDDAHLQAILHATQGARVEAILVTHSHLDHSPLAAPLAARTGAPVLAAGPSDWGRSAVMERLAAEGRLGGGEGVDRAFAPTRHLRDGERVDSPDWQIEAIATPGHMANHLSFACGDLVFSGDHVMGWATSLISPPDGDMTAFYSSLRRLMGRADRVFHAGHGEAVTDPQARLHELFDHRRAREAAILDKLDQNGATAQDLARRIYTDLDTRLLPMAERNVLAHLIDLSGRNAVVTEENIAADSRFRRL